MKNADIRKWFIRQNGKEAPSQTAKPVDKENKKKVEGACAGESAKKGNENIIINKDDGGGMSKKMGAPAPREAHATPDRPAWNGMGGVISEKKPSPQNKNTPQKTSVGAGMVRRKRKSARRNDDNDDDDDDDDDADYSHGQEDEEEFEEPLPKKHRGGTGGGRGGREAAEAPGARGGATAGGRGAGRGGGGGGRGGFFGQPRATPPHKGEKEVPQGDETCLKGLTFVISGTLDSLEREEAEVLIKSHGGRVTTSVSKKTSFLLADEDVGGRKSQKAKELGIKFLTEDELFDMIRASVKKPTERPKTLKATEDERLLSATAQEHLISKPVKVHHLDASALAAGIEKAKGSFASEGIDKARGYTGTGNGEVPRGLIPHNKRVVDSDRWKTEAGAADLRATEAASVAWPAKYAPKNINELVGNQTLIKQLHDWLQSWDRNHLSAGAGGGSDGAVGRGRGRGAGGRKGVGSSSSPDFDKKAALLSGPPGIGKTTTAKLVCQQLGLDMVEVNASDNRSKADSSVLKGIGGKMSNAIKEMVNNRPLLVGEEGQQTKKIVLIMDEVDGMSGGDRGGIADLILSIKASRIPVICICNDRYSPKLKSLINYCMHLLFRRPTKQQMARRLQQITVKEGMKVDDIALEELGERVNGDMRSALNQLQYMNLKSKVVKFADMRTRLMGSAKDEDLTAFTVVDKLFSFDGGRLRFDQRQDLAMVDPDLIPLMAAENYLNYRPAKAGRDEQGTTRLDLILQAADSISLGDIVNKKVRRSQMWALMPFSAFMSTINVAALMHGQREMLEPGQFMNRFPAWLGKNSTYGKNVRLLDDVHVHVMASGMCEPTKKSLRLDYMFTMVDRLVRPFRECDKVVGVRSALDFMEVYSLTDEDMQAMLEMLQNGKKAMDGVPPQTKAQFTREYKSRLHDRRIKSADMLPDVTVATGKGKASGKRAKPRLQLEDVGQGLPDGDDDDAELFATEDVNEADEEDADSTLLTERNGHSEFVKIEIDMKDGQGGDRSRGVGRGGGRGGRGAKRKDLPGGASSSNTNRSQMSRKGR